jgi:hypothetical protein
VSECFRLIHKENPKETEEPPMKTILILVCILLLSTAALGQTRKRTTRRSAPAKTTKAADAEMAAAAAVKTDGATKIANQIKNLTTFLYLLGGVARSIENLDAAAKTGQAAPTVEKSKVQLRQSFTDFRVGLDALEVNFRSTPALQPYYTKLVGTASGAANAEAQAAAGKFDDAGRTLVTVVGRLADVLVAMR